MGEKRKFDRCDLEEKAYIDLKGKKEEVRILDISSGGMRIVTNSPIDKECCLKGEFKLLPDIGSFFVEGKVIWTNPKDNAFESGVVFGRVSTIPLET